MQPFMKSNFKLKLNANELDALKFTKNVFQIQSISVTNNQDFDLIKRLNLDLCYRCGYKIEHECELSIEHKESWLDSSNPKKLFFDLENIGFSHLSCNCKSARNVKRGTGKHPSVNAYKEGCRCVDCTQLHSSQVLYLRKKRIEKNK